MNISISYYVLLKSQTKAVNKIDFKKQIIFHYYSAYILYKLNCLIKGICLRIKYFFINFEKNNEYIFFSKIMA